ncbi:MAG TPA: hypothetical protein VIZ17_00585 [Acetobacteraceae bacterium]
MIATYVDHIKALVQQSELGQFHWLVWFSDSMLDFLTSPLTGCVPDRTGQNYLMLC